MISHLILAFIAFCFGASLASFWGQVLSRDPGNKNSRSYCDHCTKPLSWSSLIPVLGYFKNTGLSECCQKPISTSYPLIEITNGFVFAGLFWVILTSSWISQQQPVTQLLITLDLFLSAEILMIILFRHLLHE